MVIERDRVIKRELGEHELRRRPNHDVLRPFWARERLGNEEANARELGFFGLKAGDLVDCIPPPS